MLSEINKLTALLAECRKKLQEFKEKIQHLENQGSQALQSKKQELKKLQDELTKCQQKRDKIQIKLTVKIKELKTASLTNEEKAKQITNLLAEHKKELDLFNQELVKAWISCAKQQEKIINHLTQPCLTCACKSQAVKDLKYMCNWLIGSNSLLLLIVSVFVFHFYYKWWKNKKTQAINLKN